MLLACALVATLAAAGVAGAAIGGRSARDVTSGRSRLVEVTRRRVQGAPGRGRRHRRPAACELGDRREGLPEPERVAHDAADDPRRARRRRASPSTPGCSQPSAWALYLVARRDRAFGVGLAAVLLVLVVHSLLYAGFFEDPLTWGVIGLACAALARVAGARRTRADRSPRPLPARSGAAGTLTLGRRDRPSLHAESLRLDPRCGHRRSCSPCSVSRSGSR